MGQARMTKGSELLMPPVMSVLAKVQLWLMLARHSLCPLTNLGACRVRNELG